MYGESLVNAWEAAWSALDADRLAALFTDDGIYEDAALGLVHQGREAIAGYVTWASEVFPDFGPTVSARLASNELASAEWTMTGTHMGDLPELPATGRFFSVRGASSFELRNGKIARCTDYWNMNDMLRQLGAD